MASVLCVFFSFSTFVCGGVSNRFFFTACVSDFDFCSVSLFAGLRRVVGSWQLEELHALIPRQGKQKST